MEKLKQTKFKLIKRCLSLKQSFYTRYLISEKKKEKILFGLKVFGPWVKVTHACKVYFYSRRSGPSKTNFMNKFFLCKQIEQAILN